MNRVFAAAAFADMLLLTATAVLGGAVQGTRLFGQHFSLALFTCLLTVLLHVVVFTYFSATGRMISQAVWIGHLERTPLDRVADFKAHVIRWVAASVGSIVLVASLGASSAGEPAWRLWHALAAFLAITVNAAAFHVEYGYIHQNRELMTAVLADYDVARTARTTRTARRTDVNTPGHTTAPAAPAESSHTIKTEPAYPAQT